MRISIWDHYLKMNPANASDFALAGEQNYDPLVAQYQKVRRPNRVLDGEGFYRPKDDPLMTMVDAWESTPQSIEGVPPYTRDTFEVREDPQGPTIAGKTPNPLYTRDGKGWRYQRQFSTDPCPDGWEKAPNNFCIRIPPENEQIFYTKNRVNSTPLYPTSGLDGRSEFDYGHASKPQYGPYPNRGPRRTTRAHYGNWIYKSPYGSLPSRTAYQA